MEEQVIRVISLIVADVAIVSKQWSSSSPSMVCMVHDTMTLFVCMPEVLFGRFTTSEHCQADRALTGSDTGCNRVVAILMCVDLVRN